MKALLEIRFFFLSLLAALGVIASINVYVDPSHHWHRLSTTFSSPWPKGEVLVPLDHFDERLFRREHLHEIRTPGIVFFGSSRVRKVDQSLFIPTLHSYNNGVSLASIEDDVSLWQRMKNLEKIPRYAVVFVDPWAFNSYPSLGIWKSGSDLYEQFLRRQTRHQTLWRSWTLWGSAFVHRLTFDWAEWTDLFSWETFRTSCGILRHGQVNAGSLFSPSDGPEAKARGAILPDGSWIDPNPAPAHETSEQIFTNATILEKRYLNGWTPNDRRLTLFQNLLEDLERSHVEVMVVDPPLHPQTFGILKTHASSRTALQAHREALASRAHGVPVCEALDPSMSGCVASEFSDGQHMTPSCVRKVITHCFEKWGWESLLQKN